MVLITGTNLEVSDLPNNDIVDYIIDNVKMNLKLKTVAKKKDCLQIYIVESQRTEYTITDELASKIVYFKDDEDLLRMLKGGAMSNEKDIFDEDYAIPTPVNTAPVFESPKQVEVKEVEQIQETVDIPQKEKEEEDTGIVDVVDEKESEEVKVKLKKDDVEDIEDVDSTKVTDSFEEESNVVTQVVEQENKDSSKFDKSEDIKIELPNIDLPKLELDKTDNDSVSTFMGNIEDADTELPDILLQVPNINEDIDSLREMIANKDKIIAQKDGIIQDLNKNIEEVYKGQEIQIAEIQQLFGQKLNEAQEIIAKLEARVKNNYLSDDAARFLKFHSYALKHKGRVTEGFTDEEKQRMGRLSSNYIIVTCGSGESDYSMLKQVCKLIDSGKPAVVLDFSNDNFLASTYRVKPKNGNTMSLLNDEISPLTLLKDINGVKFIPTTNYNDIALLNIDWPTMLRKIDDMAGGRPVVLVFNRFNTFSVRYTVSKLADIGKLYVFVKCSPIILSTLYSDAQFLPQNRVNIVAVDYIDVVKAILGELSKLYNVYAVSSDVDWVGKLGVK